MKPGIPLNRRGWLAGASMGIAGAVAGGALAPPGRKALVAVTLDLEMSRNFPKWEDTGWDYEKGNLTPEVKRYAVRASQRVKASGGVAHSFVVGRVLEQEDVGWLKDLAAAGHPLGNHTYDHVTVTAGNPAQLQYRFQRAPWLLRGMPAREAVLDNIDLTTRAMKDRLGIAPAGFRTPGGFAEGLTGHPEVRAILKDAGFSWVSSKYPSHPMPPPGREPTGDDIRRIVAALGSAQPFRYADGLVEVPMSPISDIVAFRTGRWRLEWFMGVIRACVARAIENGEVFDFLAHPSCLGVVDPDLKTIDMICHMVREAGDRAAFADLGALATRAIP